MQTAAKIAPAKPAKGWRYAGRWLVWVCGILLSGWIVFKLLDFTFPLPDIAADKKFAQLVVDKKGRPLRAFADSQGVWRYPIPVAQVSSDYLKILINYEDRQFYQHSGVNPLAMVRAVYQRLAYGRWVSGGSTLTMQVARIMDPHQKNMRGKLWQVFRAYQLEYHLSKSEILQLYVNYAPFGGPVEGVEAAAYTYLDKSASELSLDEAALLAVLPQSPSRFRPDRYPERAQRARDKVLKRMLSYEVLEPVQAEEAMQVTVVAQFNSRPMAAPLLARRVARENPQQELLTTTIDMDIQQPVADLVKSYLEPFSLSTSASAMVMDNQNLEVLAYVGAADFSNPQRFGHLDMNLALRSPGSTLKPFVYAMAMDQQLVHSQSLLQDVPLNFGTYDPENFDRHFSGPVSLTKALQQSLNLPAVQVLNHLGPARFAAQLENAGLKLSIPGDGKPSLSLALGGAGVRMEHLIAAYRALAAQGQAGRPRYLTGEPQQERFLMSAEAAWITGEILAQVPLEPHQSSQLLKKRKSWLAHKTGTSYGFRDAWMVAVNERYSVGVWIGKPDGTPSPGEFGRKTAAPLVRKIFRLLPQERFTRRDQPKTVAKQKICWPLGRKQSLTAPEHCHQAISAWLIDGVAPLTLKEAELNQANPLPVALEPAGHYRVLPSCFKGDSIKKDIALWPMRVDFWLPAKWQRSQLLPPYHANCANQVNLEKPLLISGLSQDAVVTVPKGSQQALQLSFSVLASQDDLSWLLNGEMLQKSPAKKPLVLNDLQPGDYQLTVFNAQGQSGQLSFRVI